MVAGGAAGVVADGVVAGGEGGVVAGLGVPECAVAVGLGAAECAVAVGLGAAECAVTAVLQPAVSAASSASPAADRARGNDMIFLFELLFRNHGRHAYRWPPCVHI
jgi:hypothetical protein